MNISNSSTVLAGRAPPLPKGYCTGINLLLVWVYCSVGLSISSSAVFLSADMLKTETPYSTVSLVGDHTIPKARATPVEWYLKEQGFLHEQHSNNEILIDCQPTVKQKVLVTFLIFNPSL